MFLLFAVPTHADSEAEPCREDVNGDFAIDAEDFSFLGQCLTGPGDSIKEIECRLADLHRDNRIDLRDAAIMQNQSGPCQLCTPQWAENLFCPSGVLGSEDFASSIATMTPWDDGTGTALFVGGIFGIAGCAKTSGIAKWDGVNWSSLEGGLAGPSGWSFVSSAVVYDDGTGPALFVGGEFSTAGAIPVKSVAKWDGTSWLAVGDFFDVWVSALIVFEDGDGPALYAAGGSTNEGGEVEWGVARWDGSSWSQLGEGSELPVWTLAAFDDGTGSALYAGGFFSVSKWDGDSWTTLGGEVSGGVGTLVVFDDGSGAALYAGGSFSSIGHVSAANIAKWNGQTWSPLLGATSEVSSMIVFDDGMGPALYVGGSFTFVGGVAANRIAKWNGTEWSSLGGGVGGHSFPRVSSLAVFDDGTGPALYAGGRFSTAGDEFVSDIAQWDGSDWSPVNLGMSPSNRVYALSAFESEHRVSLLAGGFFNAVGSVHANGIGGWDGNNWLSMGTNVGRTVEAFTIFENQGTPTLIAGGSFRKFISTDFDRIAQWDGHSWSSLGLGMNRDVKALAVHDDGTGPALYAAGEFTLAGGVPANRIARWDGISWSPLASGVSGTFSSGNLATIYALAVFDDGTGAALYAGGNFTMAGDLEVNGVAQWDGDSWLPLGAGVNNWVSVLTVFDDGSGPALYAGGAFTAAGEESDVNRIARWNGASWSRVGNGIAGLTPLVQALAVYDDGRGPALYVGGSRIASAGGNPVNNIAKWDDSSWSELASGVNGFVSTLSVFDVGTGPALFAGGGFTNAGGNVSPYLAKWYRPTDCEPPPTTSKP